MPYKNNWLTGILAGLILPALSCLLFQVLYPEAVWLNKPALPYLITIGLNLVLIRISVAKQADQTARGIMLATFAFLLFMIFVLKIKL
ncbi:hypothetical protein KHS38_06940 [Mucilaginibacter sp. Bleaf8]|uniref:hypothetical protein n=1 Tax=Mucilaginibacter sp. Bleaf8 TaxID=2834430 RepID=UPI001BCB218F|nr:hypothetical protein [Mucilaginibacter sp. Bleaf8]MBS7564137.1 hypothetical protein [Mucilaginibacter sp. Bleaf8]